MDLRRQIADFIDAAYPDWQQRPKRQPLWHYMFCGRAVECMGLEEASNIVQTRMSGY